MGGERGRRCCCKASGMGWKVFKWLFFVGALCVSGRENIFMAQIKIIWENIKIIFIPEISLRVELLLRTTQLNFIINDVNFRFLCTISSSLLTYWERKSIKFVYGAAFGKVFKLLLTCHVLLTFEPIDRCFSSKWIVSSIIQLLFTFYWLFVSLNATSKTISIYQLSLIRREIKTHTFESENWNLMIMAATLILSLSRC